MRLTCKNVRVIFSGMLFSRGCQNNRGCTKYYIELAMIMIDHFVFYNKQVRGNVNYFFVVPTEIYIQIVTCGNT